MAIMDPVARKRATRAITLTLIASVAAVSLYSCNEHAAERNAEECQAGARDAQSDECLQMADANGDGSTMYRPHMGLFTGLLGGYLLSRALHPAPRPMMYAPPQQSSLPTGGSGGSGGGFWGRSSFWGGSGANSNSTAASPSEGTVSRGGFGEAGSAHGGGGE